MIYSPVGGEFARPGDDLLPKFARDRLGFVGVTPLTFAPDSHTGGWPAALAFAEQRLGAALVPHAVLPPNQEQPFVTRPFDESFTLDEYLITRPDFSDSTSSVANAVLR